MTRGHLPALAPASARALVLVRVLGLALALALAGVLGPAACLRPAPVACGDGFCATGWRCVGDAVPECRVIECQGEPDGTPCADTGAARCMAGACAVGSCGDGVMAPGEACDEGAQNGAPGVLCHATCTLGVCGDGLVDVVPGVLVEGCDEGAGNDDHLPDTCRSSCAAPACADGVSDDGERDGCLTAAAPLAEAGTPTAVALADLDRDGRDDLVVASPDATLTIHWGGSAAPTTTAALVAPITELRTGDVDGDGLGDLVGVATDAVMATVVVVAQRPGRVFAAGVDAGLGFPPSVLDVADVDGDGRADLVALTKTPDGPLLALYRGQPGAVPFGAAEDLVAEHPIDQLQLGRFDAGDTLDLLLVAQIELAGPSLLVRPGLGDGGFGAAVLSPGHVGVVHAAVDLDDDGRLDLVSADIAPMAPARVQRSLGDGNFAAPSSLPTHAGARAVGAADLDGDGLAELFLLSDERRVTLLHNDGGLDFSVAATTTLPAGGAYLGIAVGDVDGDGFADAVAHGNDLQLVRSGDGPLGAPRLLVPGARDAALARGTFDDAALLAAITSDAVVAVLASRAPATPTRVAFAATPLYVAAGDLDGDGHTDAVVQLSPGELVIFGGDGHGGLVERERLPDGAAQGIDVVDLTGDGRAEVIAWGLGAARVRLGGLALGPALLTSHEGFFAPRYLDVDGDGLTDLLIDVSTQWMWRRSLGDGQFATESQLLVDGDGSLLVADVIPGGRPELLLYSGAGTALWGVTGAGVWQELWADAAVPLSGSLVVADLDGDGLAEVVRSDPNGLFVGHGRPGGRFAVPVRAAVLGDPVAAADLDGDGHADVVQVDNRGVAVRFGRASPATP